MKTSDSVKALATDLVIAQDKIKHAAKDSNNPHFRNDYASLESVIDATKQALLENDITVLQGMSADGSSLTTRLQHVSGEFIETELKLVLSKQDMQGLGSAITYGRRYALAAILNISQADDDGNGSTNRPAPKTLPPKKGKTAAPALQDDF
jgi:hypothetical protein